MKLHRFVQLVSLLGALSIAAVGVAPSSTQAQTAPTITVHADQKLGAISPYVLGANYFIGGIVPLSMLDPYKVSGVSYLRFPGGNWGDQNDLQTYQIDLFMAQAKMVNAEPSISVRLKGGTPQKAADMVKYVNIDQKYGVKYWSVGNEPNLYKDYNVDQYNKDWRAIAQAMLAVDPSIVLVGPDISQYPPTTDPGNAEMHRWLESFLKANGDMISVVSVHRYPYPTGDNQGLKIKDVLGNAHEWDNIIPDIRKVIKDTTNRDLPVAVTEINSHWNDSLIGAEASPETLYNAVWYGDVLGHLINQKVSIVAYWILYSDGTNGGQGGSGILGKGNVRPSYYTFQLYHQLGKQLLSAQSSDPDLTITAALRDDGTLTLMVVNATQDAKTPTIALTGLTATDQTELWRLDAEHQGQKVGTTKELSDGTLSIPALSVSLYIVKP
jgi:hypothetical protein